MFVYLAGRSSERPVLSEADINNNVAGIKETLERLLQAGDSPLSQPWIPNNLVSM